MKYKIRKFLLSISIVLIFCNFSIAELSDDVILEMLETSLKTLPEKITKLKPEVRRIAFYSLKVDRRNISQPLFRQIQGKIETVFLQLERPILVYTPEVKPLKITSREDGITFVSGFQSTKEIKEIAEKLKLDGFLEGELFLTSHVLYLNLRIFASDTMAVVWSQEFTSKMPPLPPAPKLTGVDFGLGGGGMQVSDTYANYYTAEIRILQKAILKGEKIKFTLSGSIFSVYRGIKKTDRITLVTPGAFGFSVKAGVRVSLIPALVKEGDPKRDWLATEVNLGKIFGGGTSGLITAGIRLESNITKIFSVGIGVSYIPFEDIKTGPDSKERVGGLSYEISLLRVNFTP